jgi:hypothetical protein
MSDLTIKRGDFGFYLTGTINNADDTPFDLTGYSLTLNCWEMGKWGRPHVTGTAAAVSATQGTWRYLVDDEDFTIPGEYLLNIRATKTGAQETTLAYTVDVKEAP